MKKHLLLACLFASVVGFLTAQTTIQLTFTAEVNGSYHPLDSVIIENLTQGGDTILYGTDTLLVLDHGIGIEDRMSTHGNNMILYPAFPNPVYHTSTIRFWLPKDALVTLRLYDLPGRELATFNRSLGAGEHSFTFTPGRENHYLLVAEAADQRQVQKLISLNHGDGNSQITYTGHQPAPSGMRKGRSSFPWMPGDDLRFLGYASLGIDTIEDDPVQSVLYAFQFLPEVTPCPGVPTVTDYNGNIYNTVQIGTQCWMKENLKVRNYNSGIPILNITDNITWAGSTTGARCWYNNDSATHANTFGALYNWYAVDNPNGLCPIGWHVPTDLEWQILEMHLGMTSLQANATGWRGTDEGGKMKATGLSYWSSPNMGATNASGFTALPAGGRDSYNGSYSTIADNGYWWSSASFSSSSAWSRTLYYNYSNISRSSLNKRYGFSVRCVRD
jgi:uncharacterized protein (TIGR02145 family)